MMARTNCSHCVEPGSRDQPWTPEIASRAVGGSSLHAVFLRDHDVTLLPCRAPRPIGGMTAGITAGPVICTQVPASRPGPPYPKSSCALTQSSSVVDECKDSGVGRHDRSQVESLHVSAPARSPVRICGRRRVRNDQEAPRNEDTKHRLFVVCLPSDRQIGSGCLPAVRCVCRARSRNLATWQRSRNPFYGTPSETAGASSAGKDGGALIPGLGWSGQDGWVVRVSSRGATKLLEHHLPRGAFDATKRGTPLLLEHIATPPRFGFDQRDAACHARQSRSAGLARRRGVEKSSPSKAPTPLLGIPFVH